MKAQTSVLGGDDSEPWYQITEKGLARLQRSKTSEEFGWLWKIIDEQDQKLREHEEKNQKLQAIITDLEDRTGIVVVSPVYKRTKVRT